MRLQARVDAAQAVGHVDGIRDRAVQTHQLPYLQIILQLDGAALVHGQHQAFDNPLQRGLPRNQHLQNVIHIHSSISGASKAD
ncbi:hypothetical protein [Chromobacterium sp. Beijing]|uniref:hypothetical protein n=1 Tax=Chromobacterium sp. Beijing TaxID=2735795 RepID=UPI001F1883D3|nr:hypothetical protein [Chromobacterium sp. Beijing]UJB30718.1 hypothetical protein HQN78_06325 [Chromobacterium sp. Beijing]